MNGSGEPASAGGSKGVATNGVALYSGGRRRAASSLVGDGDGAMAEDRKRPLGSVERMRTERAEWGKNVRLREQEALEAEKREKEFLTGALVFEGYLFTLLDPKHPGEEVSWTETQKAQLRTRNQVLYDKATSYEVKSGTSCAQQLRTLDSGQQALVQRLLAYKNANEGNPELEWTLFGVRSFKLYERPGNVFKALKLNHAIRIIVKRGDKIIVAEDTGDKSPDKKVLSESVSNNLVAEKSETKDYDSKGKNSVATSEVAARRWTSSSKNVSGTSDTPVTLSPISMLPHQQSGDPFHTEPVRGKPGMPQLQISRPLPYVPPLSDDNDYFIDSYTDDTASDEFTEKAFSQRKQKHLLRKSRGRPHNNFRLQQNVPDIQKELQDGKQKSGVHERRKVMNAFLARESGKQPGSRDNNTLNPRRKPRRSISDLEMSVEDTRGLEQTIPAGDGRPESLEATLRDADTETSESHDWETSPAAQTGIVEGREKFEVRTSAHYDGQEASLPGEPGSTQIEAALEDKLPIHDDVNVADFPVHSATSEKDTNEEALNTENLELAQRLDLLDNNSKETAQEPSALKLDLQVEEDEVVLESAITSGHVQEIRNTAQIDHALAQSHFWSNPDTYKDRPYRCDPPNISPERDCRQRLSSQDQLPYIYGEQRGGRGNRPDFLLQRHPQRSVSTLDNPAEDSPEVQWTSHADLPQRSQSLDEITKSLFCTRELVPIFTAAWKDADIGAERLEQNVRCLIQLLGRELESETADKRVLGAARALMTTEVSSHIARAILQHVKGSSSKSNSDGTLQFGQSEVHGTGAEYRETLQNKRGLLGPTTTTFRTFEEEVIRSNRNKDLNLKDMELIANAAALKKAETASWSAKMDSLQLYLSMIFGISSVFFSNLQASIIIADTITENMGKTLHKHLWWILLLSLMSPFGFYWLLWERRQRAGDRGKGGGRRRISGGRAKQSHEVELPPTSDSGKDSLLYNSDAYDRFRAGLLDYVHEPYEKRILLAIGGEVKQSGVHLEQDSIHCMARELSWVPVQSLTYLSDTDVSYAGAAKAFVEDRLGESWNWWPLAPRIHRLRSGYCRIQWRSVRISTLNLSRDAPLTSF
jgi:hypothetical protein